MTYKDISRNYLYLHIFLLISQICITFSVIVSFGFCNLPYSISPLRAGATMSVNSENRHWCFACAFVHYYWRFHDAYVSHSPMNSYWRAAVAVMCHMPIWYHLEMTYCCYCDADAFLLMVMIQSRGHMIDLLVLYTTLPRSLLVVI